MITKTSREIIRNATTLANADNSSFTDFFLNTTLLNNAYREAYDILVSNTSSFINTITVTDDTVLPYDCYSVISVTDKFDRPIHQDSLVSNASGGYSVQNNIFKTKSKDMFKLTYSVIPATITAPDKWIDLGTDISDIIDLQEQTPYTIKKENNEYIVNEVSTLTYLDKPVEIDYENQSFKWNNLEFYDYISRQDSDGNEIPFINVQIDSPYMAITYSDRRVYIFTGWQATEWNYLCIYGHETRGECYALYTNDVTGFGMLFFNDENSHYYYAPFVPDTILSYPNNTLFAFLEYRISYQIASLLNMNVEFLSNELARAENNFYKNLGSTNNAHRITNWHSNASFARNYIS